MDICLDLPDQIDAQSSTNRTESQVPILINSLMHALLAFPPHFYLIVPIPSLVLGSTFQINYCIQILVSESVLRENKI